MTQQAVVVHERLDRGSFRVDHSAVVTARMPDPDEITSGYPPDVPVLVVTGRDGTDVKVFCAGLTALEIDGPEGAPDVLAVADAADYVFGVIAEGLDNAGARLEELAAAARRSPGSIIELADDYRREYERDLQDAPEGG